MKFKKEASSVVECEEIFTAHHPDILLVQRGVLFSLSATTLEANVRTLMVKRRIKMAVFQKKQFIERKKKMTRLEV
ncbi:hypothetical protein BgiMline_018204 [Biomphalaria glabrata]